MMTSTTFILAITMAGRSSTELQVVQISVIKIWDDALCESKHLPSNGKAPAVPELYFKAESYWLPDGLRSPHSQDLSKSKAKVDT